MGPLSRITSLLKGDKCVFMRAERRGNDHIFVSSPDLPGFSVMLRPQDLESMTALSGALEAPLVSFIEAEWRAANSHAKHVHMRGIYRYSDSKIAAGYCAA